MGLRSEWWHYVRQKMFGRLVLIGALALAPVFWGLLALNGVVKAHAAFYEGPPLAVSSLSIVMYRYAGAVVLCLMVAAGICVARRINPLGAYVRHVSRNWGILLAASVSGCVFALPLFFLSFDFIDVVMTNIVAVGSVPIIDFLIKCAIGRMTWARDLGLVLRPEDKTVYSIGSLFVMLITLFAFVLLTFNDCRPTEWNNILAKGKLRGFVAGWIALDQGAGGTPRRQAALGDYVRSNLAGPCAINAVTNILLQFEREGRITPDIQRRFTDAAAASAPLAHDTGQADKRSWVFWWGIGCSLFYGVFWCIYLYTVSRWPSNDSHPDRPVLWKTARKPMAACFYHTLEEYQEARRNGDRRLGPLRFLEALLVKVASVQLLGLGISMVLVVLVKGLPAPAFPALSGLAAQVWTDVCHVGGALHSNGLFGFRTMALAVVVVFPSFGAYACLNWLTTKYSEQQNRPVVAADTWNSLLAFLEPFVATLIGIGIFGFGLPAGISERFNFAFPTALVGVVFLLYLLAFLVRFRAVYRNVLDTDLATYQQKLEKVYDDTLKLCPISSGVTSEDALEGFAARSEGFKESDCVLLKNCLKEVAKKAAKKGAGAGVISERAGTDMLLTFTDMRRNLVEQGVLLLQRRGWNEFSPYGVKRESGVSVTPVDFGSGEITNIVMRNFSYSAEQLKQSFKVFQIRLTEYGNKFPVESHEWREIEKGIYLYLTGSIWFKLKRHVYWTPASSASHADYALFAAEFNSMTKNRFILPDERAWPALRTSMSAATTPWQSVLFDRCVHVLDADHMVKGTKAALVGVSGCSSSDKIVLLLVPNRLTGGGTSPLDSICFELGPLAEGNKSSAGSLMVYEKQGLQVAERFLAGWVSFLSDAAGLDARNDFGQRVFRNPFILYHALEEKISDESRDSSFTARDGGVRD